MLEVCEKDVIQRAIIMAEMTHVLGVLGASTSYLYESTVICLKMCEKKKNGQNVS